MRGETLRRSLLACGVLSSLLYAAMLAFVPMRWEGYSSASLVVQSVVDLLWPPMHLRGSVTTLTDTMHVAFAIAWLLVMLVAIGAGAAALGSRFRLYSAATVATFVVFGAWSFVDGPRIAANLPTPWLGLRERINIGAALLWNCVLAMELLRHRNHALSSRT